jgi:hypothetical protein
MFAQLESLAPTERTSLAAGLRNFMACNTGPGVVVLLTDLMDKQGYAEALRYLAAGRLETYVVHVLSAEELRPDLEGELRLVDCEDAEAIDVTVGGPLLKAYDRTLQAYLAEAREFCARRGLNYLLIDNGTSVERIVVEMLRRQGLVR